MPLLTDPSEDAGQELQIPDSSESIMFKLLSQEAFLPVKATPGSAGLDVAAPRDYVIEAHSTTKIPLDISILPPMGCDSQLTSKSSLVIKNITVQAGVIDRDYTGNIITVLYNSGNKDYIIKKEDKIA